MLLARVDTNGALVDVVSQELDLSFGKLALLWLQEERLLFQDLQVFFSDLIM
jgi:hypothetical protein